MSNRTLNLTQDLYNYLLSVTSREPEILKKLREETAPMTMAMMQIGPDQGQFSCRRVPASAAVDGILGGLLRRVYDSHRPRPARRGALDLDREA